MTYGQGCAFNLSCRARQLSLPARRYMLPQPRQNTTIIMNNPTQPMMPPPMMAPRSSSMGTWMALSMLTSTFGASRAAQAQQANADLKEADAQKLQNLENFWKEQGYSFNAEGNGQFSCKTPRGDILTGDYKALQDLVSEDYKAHGTQGEPAKTGAPAVESPAAETPEVEDTPAPAVETPVAQPAAKPKRAKVHVPQGWYRATGDKNEDLKSPNLLKNCTTADEVLNKIIDTKVLAKHHSIDKAKLKADLIKYNPSIFNGNEVKPHADISKLDIPDDLTIYSKYRTET